MTLSVNQKLPLTYLLKYEGFLWTFVLTCSYKYRRVCGLITCNNEGLRRKIAINIHRSSHFERVVLMTHQKHRYNSFLVMYKYVYSSIQGEHLSMLNAIESWQTIKQSKTIKLKLKRLTNSQYLKKIVGMFIITNRDLEGDRL